MLVVMQHDATQAQIDAVCDAIRAMGYQPVAMPGHRHNDAFPEELYKALAAFLQEHGSRESGKP